jgi:succinate dehydrogenase / fumarate reductase flavoprotein subunit
LIRELREEFYKDVFVPGEINDFNPELEKAYRVADFLELGELMMVDALERNESCGGHFREEFQSAGGEAQRDDENYAFVAAWEWDDNQPILHKEDLIFENVKLATRSYE